MLIKAVFVRKRQFFAGVRPRLFTLALHLNKHALLHLDAFTVNMPCLKPETAIIAEMLGFFASYGPPRPWVLALATRAVLFAFGALMIGLGEPYDTSLQILTATDESSKPGTADARITRFAGPFANWDGVYFLSIARAGGYEFEKFHAFFPLLPFSCALLRRIAFLPLEALGITSPGTSLLLAGLLLNAAAFAVAAELLLLLGRCVVGSGRSPGMSSQPWWQRPFILSRSATRSAFDDLPLLAAYLFCITPAGVFVSVLYTERCVAARAAQPVETRA